MSEPLKAMSIGVILGTAARLYMLKVDYRQYPSYPQGYFVHISLGFIAAFLGAMAIPALLAKEYTAVTFLAVAAQQFRDIREMERKSLQNLEASELVPRGFAYIEDIAKAFESRNYLAICVSLLASGTFILLKSIIAAFLAGIAAMLLLSVFIHRKQIGDIAVVRPTKIHFENSMLMVEDIVMANIGLSQSQKSYQREALAVVVEPKDDNARATLANLGQRQAILHDIASILGVKMDSDDKDFRPMAKINVNTGRVAVVILPVEPDIESLVAAVGRVPMLESSRTKPLATLSGRKSAD